MPLSLDRCGTLGGDVEMVPTLKLLAERHPDVDFYMVGRNSGERPADVGLPANVVNPWIEWAPLVRQVIAAAGLNKSNLTIEEHRRAAQLLQDFTLETFTTLDGLVMWLGQHGTTNTPLPSIKNRDVLTKPYDWSTLYCSYLLQGINAWRDVDPWNREEVLLNADPRNYPKYRDTKWPLQHPVLAQYNTINSIKHERYGDDGSSSPNGDHNFEWWDSVNLATIARPEDRSQVWQSKVRSVYSRLEISALVPGAPYGDTVKFNADFNRPHKFGIVINETRREGSSARLRVNVLRDWVLPLDPGFMHGKWSDRSLRELGVDIQPVRQLDYISRLQSALCTFTTPSSGSGWATMKPWEAFAAGVVCFFHKDYDDQDNILSDADPDLRKFLRVDSPGQLRERVKNTCNSESVWRHVTKLQREHFERAAEEKWWLKLIEERLGL